MSRSRACLWAHTNTFLQMEQIGFNSVGLDHHRPPKRPSTLMPDLQIKERRCEMLSPHNQGYAFTRTTTILNPSLITVQQQSH